MATRIKRYEDRLECQPDLLARIEREMGPDAQIERRLFRRGGFLGLLGGKQMVEVVATVEVSDDQLMGPPPKRRASEPGPSNGHSAPVDSTAPVAPTTAPSTSQGMPTRLVPSPSELAASPPSGSERIPQSRRQLDVRADETLQVSMASGSLELEPSAAPGAAKAAPVQHKTATAKPTIPAVTPSLAKPAANAIPPAQAAERGEAALNQRLPQAMDTGKATAEPAPASAATLPNTDLADLRESITELKETVKLLVQAQARGARLEVQNLAAAKSAAPVPILETTSAPELSPEASLAQAALRAQAEEAQLLLELHGSEAQADGLAVPSTTLRTVADPLALDPSALLPTVQRQVFDRLLDWNIGPYDALELINNAITSHSAPDALSSADILKVITGNICRNMLLSGGIKLGKTPPGRVVALIGATGVGKTTTIAKLAAKFAFQEGQRVSLVSLDNYRIAAAEQLRTYSEIMGIDLDIVFSKDEFDAQLTARRHSDLVLIDTAGRSPINTKQIYELREVFAAHPPDEVHLVVGASTKGDDLRAILENFAPLGYDHIIVSKLDETRSLGTIYNISKLCKHPISYVTVGQRVPEDIRTATLQFIQQWIEQGRAV
jgi:flagellar biosynthesis protein FlhF